MSEKDPVLTIGQVEVIYLAKQLDNQIEPHENSKQKFEDYCTTKCVDRVLKLNDQSLGLNTARALAMILQ